MIKQAPPVSDLVCTTTALHGGGLTRRRPDSTKMRRAHHTFSPSKGCQQGFSPSVYYVSFDTRVRYVENWNHSDRENNDRFIFMPEFKRWLHSRPEWFFRKLVIYPPPATLVGWEFHKKKRALLQGESTSTQKQGQHRAPPHLFFLTKPLSRRFLPSFSAQGMLRIYIYIHTSHNTHKHTPENNVRVSSSDTFSYKGKNYRR